MANTTPILVASGQYVYRDEVTAATAMSPIDIAAKAADAGYDIGPIRATVDMLAAQAG